MISVGTDPEMHVHMAALAAVWGVPHNRCWRFSDARTPAHGIRSEYRRGEIAPPPIVAAGAEEDEDERDPDWSPDDPWGDGYDTEERDEDV